MNLYDILQRQPGLAIVCSELLSRSSSFVPQDLLDLLRPGNEASLEGLRSHVLTLRVCEDVKLDLLALF
jgi:hypothetical protein